MSDKLKENPILVFSLMGDDLKEPEKIQIVPLVEYPFGATLIGMLAWGLINHHLDIIQDEKEKGMFLAGVTNILLGQINAAFGYTKNPDENQPFLPGFDEDTGTSKETNTLD